MAVCFFYDKLMFSTSTLTIFKNIAVYYPLIFCFFLIQRAHGQEDKIELANIYLEQAEQIYKEQKEAIEIAKELFVQAADLDSLNIRANWMAGKLYLETVNKDRSTKYFLRVEAVNPRYRFDLPYYIGRGYQYGLDFDLAIEKFEFYKKRLIANKGYRGRDRVPLRIVNRNIEECKNGKDIIKKPSEYSIKNSGENINSVWPDYAPVLDKEETFMIFTSRRQEGNLNENVDKDNFYFEDIFISKKINGQWTPAENIGESINTTYHESCIAISANGKRLYIYSDENMGDIYYSDYDGKEWSRPLPLTDRINSTSYSERSISETSSEDVLIYTSDRPGGYGGMDIYMITKDSKGNWSRSKSLGPVINTRNDEDGPFLAYDGKTLYFSSSGHKGYGGYDVFKSVYDSTNQEWSPPINLGYPVNTPDDEVYFKVSDDNKTGYYASIREGSLGYTDIFTVENHVASGTRKKSEPSRLIETKKLELIAAKETYDPKILQITHKIHFDASTSEIDDAHIAELDSIVIEINKHDLLSIEIAGFASSDGNPRYNIDLSNKRALIVKDYFVNKGIDEYRITALGFGSIEDENETAEESRRAEVKIVNQAKK